MNCSLRLNSWTKRTTKRIKPQTKPIKTCLISQRDVDMLNMNEKHGLEDVKYDAENPMFRMGNLSWALMKNARLGMGIADENL